jgi:hypothetical protein
VEGNAVDDLNMLLSQMVLELADVETKVDTVEMVAHYTRAAVNADDAGLLLVHGRNKVETAAGTSKEVNLAHELQAETGEGPCMAAVMGGNEVYVVANTLGDDRWPRSALFNSFGMATRYPISGLEALCAASVSCTS